MKKAYLIRMSEDGNDRYVYTNIKALYNGIIDTGYDVNYISLSRMTNGRFELYDIKLTYANLVNELKKTTNLHLYKETENSGYGSLEIQEVSIKTK
jgi:hypothetical protein